MIRSSVVEREVGEDSLYHSMRRLQACQVIVWSTVGQSRCSSKVCCRRMQNTEPPRRKQAVFLNPRRISLPASIFDEEPAPFVVRLHESVVMEAR